MRKARAFLGRSWDGATARDRSLGICAAAAVVLLVLLALVPLTPAITFNQGLGYDGQDYDAMVHAFRGQPYAPVFEVHAYRLLPTALAAILPLDPREGLLLINVVASLATGALLFLLLARANAPFGLALLGVLWWAVLPESVRYVLYYPALVEGIAFTFLIALLAVALDGGLLLLAAILPLAVLTREELMLVLPFVWLRQLRGGPGAAVTAKVILAGIPAALALAAARSAPSFATYGGGLGSYWVWTLSLFPTHIPRFLATFPLALGLLAVLPFVAPGRVIAYLLRRPEWAFYVIAIAGVTWSSDDRHAMLLAPLSLILLIGPARGALPVSSRGLALLTGVHVAMARTFWPVGTDEASYLTYVVFTMTRERLLLMVAYAAVMVVAAVAILNIERRGSGPPSGDGRVVASGAG